jgi:predicted DNA-binding transcriptional regulator AlpA
MATTARIYTPEEAAPRIHPKMKPRTLERWRRLGIGPKFIRIGRRVGYTDEAIGEWHERQTRRRTAEK